ncbi:MAG: fluoride efflux transporter CrcB [Deltaproteobacteria bacterium]
MRLVMMIALCGALGCLSRYWLSSWVYTLLGRDFPWGTLVVNVVGAFCIGFIMEFSIRSTLVSPALRTGIAIGFLGGLTTFSTFSYETFRLLEDGDFLKAAANTFASVLLCLFLTWGGIVTARGLHP